MVQVAVVMLAFPALIAEFGLYWDFYLAVVCCASALNVIIAVIHKLKIIILNPCVITTSDLESYNFKFIIPFLVYHSRF